MEISKKMIATRFKYDYSLADVFIAFWSLFRKRVESPVELFKHSFPNSQIYYISSARIGIKCILKSFNLQDGASIGVQPYTCSSVLTAITAAGYHPLFIDINDQLQTDPNDLLKKLNKIDALIVSHIFGFPADIDKLKQIVGNLPVIEDCAHALYSEYKQKQLGTFFDASVFSFGNGKFPSLGGGGLIVINNPVYNEYIYNYLSALPMPGFLIELKFILTSYLSSLTHSKLVYALTNFIFSEKYFERRSKKLCQYPLFEFRYYKSISYLLKYKISRTIERCKLQNSNGNYLTMQLMGKFNVLNPKSNYLNFFAFPIISGRRDDLFKYLRSKGIISGKHFQHSLYWAMQFNYKKGDCPVFEKYVGQILTIPSNYSLKRKDLDLIIYHLNEFAGMTLR